MAVPKTAAYRRSRRFSVGFAEARLGARVVWPRPTPCSVERPAFSRGTLSAELLGYSGVQRFRDPVGRDAAGRFAPGHVVSAKALFGSCLYILENILTRYGVEVTFVDGTDLDAWRAALRPDTKAVFFESMKIACLGGGPAGLYFAISTKLRQPDAEITVFERNKPDDTFGWGVVLSDDALENLTTNDPVSAGQIRDKFAYWDDIAVVHERLGNQTPCDG